MLIAFPLFWKAIGTFLGGLVSEQQSIGHIVPAMGRKVLLPQMFRPAETAENRPDQVVLGLALVGRMIHGKAGKDVSYPFLNLLYLPVIQGLPLGHFGDGFIEKASGKQTALEYRFFTH
ncbi:MAG: hypothetical protein OXI10_04065 [Gammaproteobacteria bacterium]|nr:hypothetical protein [Gammaproteobacteria bacterium]